MSFCILRFRRGLFGPQNVADRPKFIVRVVLIHHTILYRYRKSELFRR